MHGAPPNPKEQSMTATLTDPTEATARRHPVLRSTLVATHVLAATIIVPALARQIRR